MESSTPNTSNKSDATYTIIEPPSDAAKARLNACLEASYELRLREKAGRFTLCIAELGLLAHGKDMESAYAKLMQAKEQRIREYAAEDLLAWLPKPDAGFNTSPARGGNEPRLLVRLRPFLIKAAIVCAIFLWAMDSIDNSTRNIGYRLEKKLDGLANWSPETIEKHRAKSAQIAEKLGPTVRELTVMFHDPAPPMAKAPRVDAAKAAGTDAANATMSQ
jgi:hypothetical protein